MKNKQEPAFPLPLGVEKVESELNGINPDWNKSMAKHECSASEGIELTIKTSYLFADELLKQEKL